ncbi:FadR/GntR family transcriptional regulator [Hyphomonas sp.]|uniref:FadR/GntR family transcriptional regulator n=1 Tax=Hyphomonas sp. TaxID=87 RepID=UPI003D2AF5FD
MNLANAPAADRGSLVQHAISAIRRYIQDNAMRVGDSLPGEGYFADKLSVSRAVIREAFGALAALSVLDVANGRRARVGAMDGSVFGSSLNHGVATSQITVADVWDVRQTVELRTAELAALKRTDAQAASIMEHARAMRDSAHDFDVMTQYDIAFHEAIAEATGNAFFSQMVNSFAPLMEVAVPRAWKTRTTPAQKDIMIFRHLALAEAIMNGDAEAAVAAMKAHFDTSVGDILRSET